MSAYYLSPCNALAAAHALLMAAITRDPEGAPSALLHAAVEVADALEAVAEDEDGDRS